MITFNAIQICKGVDIEVILTTTHNLSFFFFFYHEELRNCYRFSYSEDFSYLKSIDLFLSNSGLGSFDMEDVERLGVTASQKMVC